MAERARRGRPRLDQPMTPRRGPLVSYDPESFGRTTETIARFLGTGRYLVIQSGIIVLWIIANVIPGIPHFDQYPFGFLTLVLSLQAAYAAPLILLAQNRQDDRDRINMDDDRAVAAQNKAEVEYLAREIAAIRVALGDVATRDFIRSELTRLADRDRGKGEKGRKDKRSRPDPATGDGRTEQPRTGELRTEELLAVEPRTEDDGPVEPAVPRPSADHSE